MLISLLVASSENNIIGIDNRLPWQLSDDLKNFKKLTTGHTVLMGRHTFESIGRALPNRRNIVLSTHHIPAIEGVDVFADLPTAIQNAKQKGETELFVIGGGKVYAQTMDLADKLYWTRVQTSLDGDTTFLPTHLENWKLTEAVFFAKNEKNEFDYRIEIWEKIVSA